MLGTPGTGNARRIPINVQKNMQFVPSAGKQQLLPRAGKQAAIIKHKKKATIAKRGKTSNHWQARENMQRLPSAGK